jgi:hypothetical protein
MGMLAEFLQHMCQRAGSTRRMVTSVFMLMRIPIAPLPNLPRVSKLIASLAGKWDIHGFIDSSPALPSTLCNPFTDRGVMPTMLDCNDRYHIHNASTRNSMSFTSNEHSELKHVLRWNVLLLLPKKSTLVRFLRSLAGFRILIRHAPPSAFHCT